MNNQDFIDYKTSIDEMNNRLNKINKNFFEKYGNEFDNTWESFIDAIQIGDEYGAEIILDYINEITAIRISANFGNPNMHVMQPLLTIIFDRLEKVVDVPVPPYGIVDSNKINAAFNRKKTDSDVMMLGFSSELFTYAQLICKVIATIIIDDSQDRFVLRTDYSDRIDQKIIGRYTEIVFNAAAPLLSMDTVRALKYPCSLMNASYLLCDIFETFVAAHEHAHVFFEFASDRSDELRNLIASRPKWSREVFADYLGAINCMKALEAEKIPQELIVIGITVAMNSLSVLDLYDYILFEEKLNDNYLPFPNRIIAFDHIALNDASKEIIQIINNLFISLWNQSINVLMELKKLYDEMDTIEDFICNNTYQQIINFSDNEAEMVNILDILKPNVQQHPELFLKTLEGLLIRNIIRFKTGKYDKASNGFEGYIYSINNLANDPENFWYQQAIAMCFLAMIHEKKGQQEKALSLLRDIHIMIKEPLKSKGLTLIEETHDSENNPYISLLSQTFSELIVLAEGDENKTKLARYLKPI